MSSLLFNIFFSGERNGKIEMEKGEIRGRVYTMAYVDDVVMLVENEEMKSVIERLKQYLDRKKLETNTGKTKIMRFRKGSGREGKRDWRGKEKAIQEMKEFKYLSYMLQKYGKQEAHVRDRVKRAAAVMGQVLRIKKRFGKD